MEHKNLKMKEKLGKLEWSSIIYGVITPAIMGVFLFFFENETFYRIQELNIFVPGSTFYRIFSEYPGGTLQWLGCFFTQFFYYPAWGCTILVAMWMMIYFIMRSAFKLKGAGNIIPLIAIVSLLASIVEMGYFIFYMKLQGYFFVATIGCLIVSAAIWLFNKTIHKKVISLCGIIIWTALGYPLLGAYALLGTLCMIIMYWRAGGIDHLQRIVMSIVGLLSIIGVPLIAWQFYAQTSLNEIYTAALPSFDIAATIYDEYKTPYYILIVTFILSAIFYQTNLRCKRPIYILLAHVAILAGAIVFLQHKWYINENFQKELKMTRAIENLDWEEVLRIYIKGEEEPTRLMVMNKNLALFRLGRAGNEMFQYREGGAHPKAPFKVRLVQMGGKMLYYHYGQENYCYRWCMEDGVTYGWKVEYLKYMAKTSLINNDFKVAEKYLNILKKTMFHKDWAEKYTEYLYQPKKIRESEEFKPIIDLLPPKNELASDLSVIEMYLMTIFANGNSDNPVYQEQTLIAALQMKDISLFWPRFFKYAEMHIGQHMPRYYQEAAYLYGHLENKVNISQMPFDQEVKDTYKRFTDFAEHCRGMSEEQMAKAFRPQFGHTFFYFYFLVNGLQTY